MTDNNHTMPADELRHQGYVTANLNHKGFSEDVVRLRVALLNDYCSSSTSCHDAVEPQWQISSAIMIEFLCFLFKDLVDYYKKKYGDVNDVLKLGQTKVYAGLYLKARDLGNLVREVVSCVNCQRQDFAIYRPALIKAGDTEHAVNMPMVVIKTARTLDNATYNAAAAMAEKIKSGNPYSKFFVVTETCDSSFSPIFPLSRIDQAFVFRKCVQVNGETPPPICSDVVNLLVKQVACHMEGKWSDSKGRMEQDGLII